MPRSFGALSWLGCRPYAPSRTTHQVLQLLQVLQVLRQPRIKAARQHQGRGGGGALSTAQELVQCLDS